MGMTGRAGLPATVEVAGRLVPVEAVRRAASRGIRLRADAVAGVVRLSLPMRGSSAEAARFLAAHTDWIAAQVGGWPAPLPFAADALIPFDGAPLRLHWSPGHSRNVVHDGDRLQLGGPVETVAPRTARWLKAQALADMARTTRTLAAAISRPVSNIAVRDPRGRWGSCASGGRINYSWRLILAPAWVRGAVVAHEVAHLVHANHGPEFHALLAELEPRAGESRRWLRANGAALHWVGRSS